MTRSEALRIALQVIRKEIQSCAFNAQLCDQYGVCDPDTEQASSRLKELTQAEKILGEMGGTEA